MRLSDFQTQQVPARNFEAERLCDANARKVLNGIVNYRDTAILSTMGAAESQPYGRDSAIASLSRRDRLHKAMDSMCADADFTAEESDRFHKSLDRMLARAEADNEPSESESESEELSEDGEPEEASGHLSDAMRGQRITKLLHGALDQLIARTHSNGGTHVARDRSYMRDEKRNAGYICDADYITRYFDPNESCIAAENRIRPLALTAQKDKAARGYWSGLYEFLHSQPNGTRIRDCRPQTLSMLISRTLAA